MNVSMSMNAKCLAAFGEGNAWQCLFGENAVRYVSTPMFILNSKYDTWQEKAILGLQCEVTKCSSDQEAFWVTYGHQMVRALAAVPSHHAAFIANCPAHCQTG